MSSSSSSSSWISWGRRRTREKERKRRPVRWRSRSFKTFLVGFPFFLFFARFSGLYLFLTHEDGTPCRSVCWPSSPFGTLSVFLFFSFVVEYWNIYRNVNIGTIQYFQRYSARFGWMRVGHWGTYLIKIYLLTDQLTSWSGRHDDK